MAGKDPKIGLADERHVLSLCVSVLAKAKWLETRRSAARSSLNEMGRMCKEKECESLLWPAWRPPTAASIPVDRPAADAGEANGDRGPFSRRACDPNVTLMFLDNLLDGGQAQAGSGPLGREEGLEHLVDMLGGDGSAVVLDENLHLEMTACPLVAHGNGQDTTRCHGLDGILEDTQEDLLHFGFVAPDRGNVPSIFFDDLNPGDFQFCGDDGE